MEKNYDEESYLAFDRRVMAIIEFLKINSPKLAEDLNNKCIYWAPETKAELISNWLISNFPVNSEDPVTLCVCSLFSTIPANELAVQWRQLDDSSHKK